MKTRECERVRVVPDPLEENGGKQLSLTKKVSFWLIEEDFNVT